MRLFTVVILCLTGCTAKSGDPVAAPSPPPPEVACRSEPSLAEQSAATGSEMLLLAAARARNDDIRCGEPAPEVAVCRALLIVANLEPTLYTEDPEILTRVSQTLDWTLREASGATDQPNLEFALKELTWLNRAIADSTTDAERAQLVIKRGRPEVAEPLEEAWELCTR